MKKNKVIILASIIVGLLVVTLGLTYAVLSFNQTGGNSQLVLGDIYMHYGETNQINLQNAIPTESYIPNGYFEFTINGKNTYTKKDIWYEIVLNHGDNHETRTTRIRDDLLKFRLVEVNNNVETELFTNKSYSSLENQRIWVDTISKNTTSEINKTYRLYMWISNDTKVGNTSDADYDNETWNEDVYGSIKVNVMGDFSKKKVENSKDFKTLVMNKNTDTCKTYVEEDGIIYISGTKDCIDFNYVWYSGKLWRITAIYPDGTMKMITDNNITTIAYSTMSSNEFYIDENNKSYMYQWLNEDFLDTLYNYRDIIVTDYKWNTTSSNKEIEYKLPTSIEEGATLVTAPVGLLNSYEYYMGYSNADASTNYLNIGYYWWILNKHNTTGSITVWDVRNNGGLYGDASANSYGVRPSIILKQTIEFVSGSGTEIDPYKIKGDKEDVVANTTLLNTRTSGEYVTFAGENYRIVSTQKVDGKVTTKLNQIDYVKDESNTVISKKFASTVNFGLSTNSKTNDYFDYYLNNTWLKLIDSTYKESTGVSSILAKGTYYLGIVDSSWNYKLSMCKTASNVVSTADCEKTTSTWTGYVGLPRYGEMFASQQNNGYSMSNVIWLITPNSSSYSWIVSNFSHGTTYINPETSYFARPSINLNSEIVITGGTGLPNDPYQIALPTT